MLLVGRGRGEAHLHQEQLHCYQGKDAKARNSLRHPKLLQIADGEGSK